MALIMQLSALCVTAAVFASGQVNLRIPAEIKDNHSECNAWAKIGECQRNPGFMLIECIRACDACAGKPDECKVDPSSCRKWAKAGECQKNPGYMLTKCKLACDTDGFDLGCNHLGGVNVGEQCLYFQTNWDEQLDWANANGACLLKGGLLASLINPKEVYDYAVAKYDGLHFYTGASDSEQEGVWVWLNGIPFAADFPWAAGEPNNLGAVENCLVMYTNGYYDIPCDLKMRYICELD